MSAAGSRPAWGLASMILLASLLTGCAIEVNVQDHRDQTDHSQQLNTYEQGETNVQGDQP